MHAHLPRLAPEFYQGFACVHWIMTVEKRQTGWLNARSHAGFREILIHTASRYGLLCPTYCLMPDHLHLLIAGVRDEADQKPAIQFFRKYTNDLLKPYRWQKQPYDNVLSQNDRRADAFVKICTYVLENPVRANLVENWEEHPFSGAIIAGYPTLSPRQTDYWSVFWRIYNGFVESKVPSDVAKRSRVQLRGQADL